MNQPAQTVRICQNCGAELLGDHCYRCGQPIKGLVRHFTSIVGDFFDSVFDFDGRFFRTVPPLLLRPGYLSTEYFAGRRVRYVSPVRLFFFTCVVTFFVAQLSVDVDDAGPAIQIQPGTGIQINAGPASGSIAAAETVDEVERLRDAALARLDARIGELREGPGKLAAQAGLEAGKAAIEAEAARRITVLEEGGEEAPAVADAPDIEAPAAGRRKGDGAADGQIRFNQHPWDPVENPVRLHFLTEGMNAWLNRQIGRGKDNIERVQSDPNLLKDAFLSSIPAALFVLLPIFALMLKVLYLFKRRLYMEHLIVALHSHAFLCAALLVVFLLKGLGSLLGGLPWAVTGLGWMEVAVLWWMPIYLLLAQKRIYGQGWIMTGIKYSIVGSTYLFMVLFGAVFVLLASFIWL